MIGNVISFVKHLFQKLHIIGQQPLPDGEVLILFKHPWLIIANFLLLVLYFFAPIKVVVICLFSLSGTLLCSWWWAKIMSRNIHAERKLQFAALQVGDELEENIILVNDSILPVLWIRLEDHSDFPEYSIRSVRAIDSNGRIAWRNHRICKQRGVFSLGPWETITSDPFGIFEVHRVYTTTQPMVVYPPLASLPASLLPHGKQMGDLKPLNQPVAAETILASQTRPYQPGDPLRRIHWPTSAKLGTPYIKILDPEAASRIWLIPDLDPNVHFGSGSDSSEETLVLLLAALSTHLLGEHRAVGLYSAADPPQIVLPQRGPAHIWTLLAALTPLHTNQTASFAAVLAQAGSLISSRDLVIVVTPSLDLQWMRTLSLITHGQGRSESWAFILDPMSFGGQQQAEPVLVPAASLGITARVVRQGEIKPQPGSYGPIRRWEFISLGTGKVVVRNAPRQSEEFTQPEGTIPW
jgi:uncharacterized protein (DUF58 family)